MGQLVKYSINAKRSGLLAAIKFSICIFVVVHGKQLLLANDSINTCAPTTAKLASKVAVSFAETETKSEYNSKPFFLNVIF